MVLLYYYNNESVRSTIKKIYMKFVKYTPKPIHIQVYMRSLLIFFYKLTLMEWLCTCVSHLGIFEFRKQMNQVSLFFRYDRKSGIIENVFIICNISSLLCILSDRGGILLHIYSMNILSAREQHLFLNSSSKRFRKITCRAQIMMYSSNDCWVHLMAENRIICKRSARCYLQ